jgi:hypothetical protein
MKYEWEEVEDFQEGCRAIRLIGALGLAAYISYVLVFLPIWIISTVRSCKFSWSIKGWLIPAGIVTVYILVNSCWREISHGGYKQRRIGEERYQREKALVKEGSLTWTGKKDMSVNSWDKEETD